VTLLAFAMRLLFWQATADAGWPGSVWYKGDAITWLGWAEALRRGAVFEAGLPVRPPGAAYLIAALGEPAAGLFLLKLTWCLLGALAVGLIYVAVRRSFSARAALVVGLLCAVSSGLMILSTSLNNETPYLLVVAATLALWRSVRERPTALVLAAWAALHAGACLLRAEHLLYFGLLWLPLAAHWLRGSAATPAARWAWKPTLGRFAILLAIFTLSLSPWHLRAWGQIERFNTQPLPTDAATEATQARIESILSWITWSPEATAELERLPTAIRRTARLFITATEGVRGRSRVEAGGIDILEQAFGYIPEPLPRHPYLVLYGGLNFHLANHAASRGGFSRRPLERRPPLTGGPGRYPTALIQGLPPVELTLTYPPHLEAIEHGYRLGWEWIAGHPGDFARLVGSKLRIFWGGAALGLGGYNLPLGLSGVRRPVDLVVPDAGILVGLWQLTLLALTLGGVWVARRDAEAQPWILFLASRLLVTAAFFGYARQGATSIPVVILLTYLAVQAVGKAWSARRAGAVLAALAILLLALEAGRTLSRPEVTVDGRPITATAPFPPGDHNQRSIQVR